MTTSRNSTLLLKESLYHSIRNSRTSHGRRLPDDYYPRFKRLRQFILYSQAQEDKTYSSTFYLTPRLFLVDLHQDETHQVQNTNYRMSTRDSRGSCQLADEPRRHGRRRGQVGLRYEGEERRYVLTSRRGGLSSRHFVTQLLPFPLLRVDEHSSLFSTSFKTLSFKSQLSILMYLFK
ncbi:uncharacterized protein LOC107263708 [Cephus cinctus]|uniref:Uncharacterized protein LOC107263708 n=1 Tax=Cephus cinctus TaxID=211228 RepID=A0AAJ7VXD6_CEPCN|nr:uncharacterized protein LOC107263708 [Cephus cinctus]